MKNVIISTCLMALFVGCGTSPNKSGKSGPKPQGKGIESPEPGKEQQPPEKAPKAEPVQAPKAEPVQTPDVDSEQEPEAAENEAEEEADSESQVGPVTCTDQWNRYVDANSAGEFLVYTIKSHVKVNGFESESESKLTQEVESASDESVKWLMKTEINGATYPSEMVMIKETFIDGCENAESNEVESGEETLETAAGSFETKWTVTRMEANGNVTTSKSYVADRSDHDSFLVKSISDTVMENGTSSSVMELIDTNK